jgi:hypothetical protein
VNGKDHLRDLSVDGRVVLGGGEQGVRMYYVFNHSANNYCIVTSVFEEASLKRRTDSVRET